MIKNTYTEFYASKAVLLEVSFINQGVVRQTNMVQNKRRTIQTLYKDKCGTYMTNLKLQPGFQIHFILIRIRISIENLWIRIHLEQANSNLFLFQILMVKIFVIN